MGVEGAGVKGALAEFVALSVAELSVAFRECLKGWLVKGVVEEFPNSPMNSPIGEFPNWGILQSGNSPIVEFPNWAIPNWGIPKPILISIPISVLILTFHDMDSN